MNIHFVCAGNTNRSRMAEAYLNSKKVSGILATSSGIFAHENINGALSKYAKNILEENNLLAFTAKSWTQTSRSILERVDIIIFMQPEYLQYVEQKLNYHPPHYRIWNIPDVPSYNQTTSPNQDADNQTTDKRSYMLITQKVDALIQELIEQNKKSE